MTLKDDLQSWFEDWHISDTTIFSEWIYGMRLVEFDAGEQLVSAGAAAKHIFLVQSGLLRLYYTTPQGKERNKAFYGARQITGAVSAAMTSTPAPFSIEALEPGTLIKADFQSLLQLTPHHPQANQLFIRLLSQAFIRNEQREASFLTHNAEQRYKALQQQDPELMARIPQFHIASYLGIDAVSLSRLKNKIDLEGE